MENSKGIRIAKLVISLIAIIGLLVYSKEFFLDEVDENSGSEQVNQPVSESTVLPVLSPVPAAKKTLEELVAAYGDIPIIDAHNHNAGSSKYNAMLEVWDKHSIDRVVLFGAVSEPVAVETDQLAWRAYLEHPDRFIPFFSGVNLLEESGIETVRANLEKGYFGIGEIAAASIHSPLLANVPWKTKHPMDGVLPQIYELCAEYKAPLLLHIDPLNGVVIDKLLEAVEKYPDTTFILAHANAYNSPGHVELLLEGRPNLYADFFAGFTAFNKDSEYTLEDYVPVIKKYPDRFLLSTDSGFGLESEEVAIEAVYQLIDALDDRELAKQVAYDNLDALIQQQPVTATQLAAIDALNLKEVDRPDMKSLSKVEAAKIIYAKQ
ncbi:amidohydrolase family protein [Paenibacillus sp. L3-i20]|uniref:amidohydrolase family protein n=1 Tax=Paenibacillus sp. L3-i20 TaxID=2905833 RepID=UPI001EDDC63E|nr:amidohydrolase family protein [Paenibacillus sp. L3-i20]GKU77640.1 hypothetical protein L3i20_v220370 [Paenibacillus sp. L3-i20]